MDPAQFKARIDQIHADLDLYDYYELLNLKQDAPFDQIQEAFHRMALSMHPDRHHAASDQELKHKLHAIYKRVSEGYRVLMNPDTRREYQEGLERGERRMVRKERKLVERPENAITNPQAKKFYLMGKEAEDKGDLKTAIMHYKFAMDMEGDHPMIKGRWDMLNDIIKMKKRSRRTTGSHSVKSED